MHRATFPTLFCLLTMALFSQQDYEPQSYQNQLEFRHDNDFFFLTDRYYSSGLFVSYRTILTKGVFGNGEQLDVALGQEVYTPFETQSFESELFDRPYVGFTGLSTNWSIAQEKSIFTTAILFGIAGNNSGAGGFQRWYHGVIPIFETPKWINELNNSFHSNLYASYTKEWKLAPNPFGVRVALSPKLAFGTRDIFGEAEAVIHFGRRNEVNKSIAYNRLGSSEREIYFALRFAYREVLHNGLIEGNLLGDDSPVLRETEASLLLFGFDFNHRFDQNDYKVGIRYNTKEAPNAESHIYLQLSYALSF